MTTRWMRILLGSLILPATICIRLPAARAADAAPCVGDCDGCRAVTINELVACVNLALGTMPVSSCPACDADGDGRVEIDEIIMGVNNARDGCPCIPPYCPF
jgi:hypothetical protein